MNWDEIRKDYEQTGISIIDLAAKYNVKYPTIKSRKQRQNWTKKDASKDASGKGKDASKRKPGGQPGNTNAAGHGAPIGNPNALGNTGGAPIGNQNAGTHGFYSKYIPVDEIDMLIEAPGAGQLDADLKLARYKLARLLQFQKDYRLTGSAVTGEDMIQKQIKLISELEYKIHKMQSHDNPGQDESVSIVIKRKEQRT